MKFIVSNRETQECLNKWTGDPAIEVLTASYYFWNSGTEKQKSQQGLFQTLLYHIFRAAPRLIETFCPHRNVKEPWSLRELKDTIHSLRDELADCYVCFFVDGLDEYQGDEEHIIEVIRDLAACPWMKICASSRPWTAFQAQWNSSPNSLAMQDFTRNDMRIYAQGSLELDTSFRSATLRDERCLDLGSEIVARAEGIWLWVHLVVRELLRDVRDNEPYEQLRRRLHSYPTDLGTFFSKIFARIDRVHAKSAARLMLSSIIAVEPLSIMALVLLEEDDAYVLKQNPQYITERELQNLFTTWRGRLHNRCRDLMKMTRDRGHVTVMDAPGDFHEYRVHFLHRTLRDYLIQEQSHVLQTQASETFDARLFLCRQKLLMLKRSKVAYAVQTHDVLELLFYANQIENDCTRVKSEQLQAELYEVIRDMDKTMKRFDLLYQREAIRAQQMRYTAGVYLVPQPWTKHMPRKQQQWPDISWLAASAGLTNYITDHIAIHSEPQHLSELLL